MYPIIQRGPPKMQFFMTYFPLDTVSTEESYLSYYILGLSHQDTVDRMGDVNKGCGRSHSAGWHTTASEQLFHRLVDQTNLMISTLKCSTNHPHQISYSKKLEIIQEIERGEKTHLAWKYGVNKLTIKTVYNKKSKIHPFIYITYVVNHISTGKY